jgi:hypothetical protein
MKNEECRTKSHYLATLGPSSSFFIRHLAALALAVGLGWLATPGFAALVAADKADNNPYPSSHFQLGDNGGYGFLGWVELEFGGYNTGSRYMKEPGILPSARYAWWLGGKYVMGRGLTNALLAGTWHLVAVHNPDFYQYDNYFSGFNLKSSTQLTFGDGELLRVIFDKRASTGISVSINGGSSYTFLDCGWTDGDGDTNEYDVGWDGFGNYTLAVTNLTEGKAASFRGTMASGAVAMLGVVTTGANNSKGIAFDGFEVNTDNSETWFGGGTHEVLINAANGTAGSFPGWNLRNIAGSLTIEATPTSKFTIKLKGPSGGPSGFSDSGTYSWEIAWAAGSVVGFNRIKFAVDVSGFGTTPTGTFDVVLNGKSIYVVYAPAGGLCTDTTAATYHLGGTGNTEMHMLFENLSGLTSVQALIMDNCSISWVAYASDDSQTGSGSGVSTNSRTLLPLVPKKTTKVELIAVKTGSGTATVNAIVMDICGRGKSFDPVITRLEVTTGNLVQQRFTGLLAAEHYLQVINDTPGLRWLELNLNGHVFRLDPLAAGQTVAADLAAAMDEGDANVVVLTGAGEVGSSALVLITDASSGNLVELTEIVKLTLSHTASGLLLSWPEPLVGWQLQASTAADANWSDVTNAPVTVAGQLTVPVLTASHAQFYRLRSPTGVARSATSATTREPGTVRLRSTTNPVQPTQRNSDGVLW